LHDLLVKEDGKKDEKKTEKRKSESAKKEEPKVMHIVKISALP